MAPLARCVARAVVATLVLCLVFLAHTPDPVAAAGGGHNLPGNPGDIGIPSMGRQDEVSLRVEPELGRPSRLVPNQAEGPWLFTEAHRFVSIKQTAYFRSNFSTVNGHQMTSSFVAESPTTVAIYFAAEAYVGRIPGSVGLPSRLPKHSPPPRTEDSNFRMFVRALVDEEPVDPSNVVFAVGNKEGVRSFIFTTSVEAGIHTLEMQWMVDEPSRGIDRVYGFMRSASLMVRQGKIFGQGIASGYQAVRTAPSGLEKTKDVPGWSTIPNMLTLVHVPPDGVLVASFSGESFTTGDARMAVRARIDNNVMAPADVIFAEGGKIQSRTVTFMQTGVSAGVHVVDFQWLRDGVGTIVVGDRSMVANGSATTSLRPTHPVVALEGVQDMTGAASPEPVPGMELITWIPELGNGEVAVIVSAEVAVSDGGELLVVLEVDGALQGDLFSALTTDEDEGEVRHWIFDTKKLTPGYHQIVIKWSVRPAFAGITATMGDRVLALIAEVAAIPDLAEAPLLGPGRSPRIDNGMVLTPDHMTGLEPVIGARDVLTILWDADRPGQPDQNSFNYGPDDFEEGIYTDSSSVKNYFERTSGGRFTINNAGIVGWFDALLDINNAYWNHPVDMMGNGICSNGYTSGAVERASEAVKLAAADGFPFSDYDDNNDGEVEPSELAIAIIHPQDDYSGRARQPIWKKEKGCMGAVDDEPLVVDGVVIEDVLECFGCTANHEMVIAHELAHQALGLDDMYMRFKDVATRAAWKALMALPDPENTTIVNPAYRLALGWVTPRIIETKGLYDSIDTKLGDQVFVLPRYRSTKRDEYFLLENRMENVPQGLDRMIDSNLFAQNHDDNGIGVWHVVEEVADRLIAPIGVNALTLWNDPTQIDFTQSRQGIRLLRPWVNIEIDTLNAVFLKEDAFWTAADYDLQSAVCPLVFGLPGDLFPARNTLTWADCTASGYALRFLSNAPNNPHENNPQSTKMNFELDIE